DRSGRVPRKYRRYVRRRRILPATGVHLHSALRQSEDEAVERQGRPRKYRAFHPHHEQARLHEHLQTSLRVRQENRAQARYADRETKCAARNWWFDDALL